MRKRFVFGIACILAALLAAPALAAPAQLEPANTYAVIVGVLEWPSKTLSGWSKENRRDQGLYDRLRAMGVPKANMALVLGKEATNANMLKAVKDVARRAGKGSSFLFYYAGHGYPGSKGIYFASYDAGSRQVPEGFLVNDVATILKASYKGDRVLLMADCCHSGGLAEVARELSQSGFKAASMTSASIAKTSASQWTFTCCVIDALRGRRLLDLDGDGYVSISEAGHDVKEAMNFRHSQHHGFALHGMGKSFRLSRVRPDEPKARPIPKPYTLRQYVKLDGKGKKAIARIIDCKDGKLKLESQRYHSRQILWHAPDAVAARKRPDLPAVPASSLDFPNALSPEEAGKKATVNGKYSKLLRKITVKFDYLANGAFSDYGHWKFRAYAGYTDLPEGYWVYVYPDWYIFEKKTEPPKKK